MAKITKKFLVNELAALRQKQDVARNQVAVLSGAIQVAEQMILHITGKRLVTKNGVIVENEEEDAVTENEEEDAPAATDRPPVPDQGPE